MRGKNVQNLADGNVQLWKNEFWWSDLFRSWVFYGQLQSSVIKKMHENSTENSLHVNFGVNFSFSILLKGVKSSQLHSAENYIGNQQMILKNLLFKKDKAVKTFTWQKSTLSVQCMNKSQLNK